MIIIKPAENVQLQTIENTVGKEEKRYFVNKTADYQAYNTDLQTTWTVMLGKDR